MGGIACEPGRTITYENRTDRKVTLLENGVVNFTLDPLEKKKFTLFEFTGTTTFQAKDDGGNLIYSETLTWDDLKRRGWKIIITEAAPTGRSSTPTGGR